MPKFLVASGDLNALWENFLVRNQAVLDAMLDGGDKSKFSTTLKSEVCMLYISVVNVVEQFRTPTTNDQIKPSSATGSLVAHDDGNIPNGSRQSNSNNQSSKSRLRKIPWRHFRVVGFSRAF